MELTQIRLLVSDFPAVYRFYRDVLGLKPQFEAESGPYAKLSPDTGHAAIALQDRAQLAGVLERLGAEPAGHRALVVLRVDDLDAAHAELTARGEVHSSLDRHPVGAGGKNSGCGQRHHEVARSVGVSKAGSSVDSGSWKSTGVGVEVYVEAERRTCAVEVETLGVNFRYIPGLTGRDDKVIAELRVKGIVSSFEVLGDRA
jgi:catechol 2,3-dioxygenase-like lactoylglutathione lyase family enzyme